DDEEIDDAGSLSNVIGGHEPGDTVTVTYMRDGKEQKTTGELGKGKPVTVEPFQFKYKLDNPDLKALQEQVQQDQLRQAFQEGQWPKMFGQNFVGNSLKFGIRAQDAEDGKGVKVLDVDDESTAAKAGIREGDVITRFDGKEINSVMELTDAAHSAKNKVSVKVTIVRDGKAREIDVKVPKVLRTADL
ncbi:MAG TPA: PDZ domain-containing protein, partial [Puia sp.]|nr:PDZ domain-containing protein [Puia sp.]